jgi:chitinase
MRAPRSLVALAATSAIGLALGVGGTTGTAAAPRPGAHVTKHQHRWVMGYYPIYQRALMPPTQQIDWSAMTHLIVGALLPRADGTLDTSFDDDPVHGPKIAKTLARRAKHHAVVPMLMVGGAGAHDGFVGAATHHRKALVKRLVATMHAYHFAGLDLDWEPVQRGEAATIEALVRALRKRAPHAVLTMPVGWVTRTFPKAPAFYGTLAKRLDRIDVMTYGMAGAYDGWKTWHSSALKGAGPSTPSDVALNVRSYEKAGVPARKLGIGIGFYGTCWAGGVTGPRQSIGSSYVAADDNVMTYNRIRSTYLSASAYHYDATAQAPYLGYAKPHGPQHCTFVSYENPRSIAAKGRYAEKHGLGAEIIWTVNQAHIKGASKGKSDPLLRAVHHSFH